VPRLAVGYWGDEALTVGIARHPLASIPGLLRFDGSPPLYYWLLHAWIAAFGTSEAATHSLSLFLAAACVPTGWWCGRALAGTGAGWAAASLLAFSPYLTTYGTETRMYSLLALEAIVALGCFARLLIAGGRRALAGAVVSSAAVVYTHNWGLYLVAAMVGVGAVVAGRERQPLVAAYAAAIGLAYLPWLPSLLHQVGHTGAPWSPRPTLGQLVNDPLRVSAWAWWPALAAAVLVAVAMRFVEHPGARAVPGGRALALPFSGAVCATTVAAGWTGAQLVRSWSPRYLGVAVVPALGVLGAALVRTAAGRAAVVGVCAVFVVANVASLTVPADRLLYSKSNAAWSVADLAASLQPGDLVVSAQVSQLPLVTYYAGRQRGVTFATPLGAVSDPSVVDWDDLPTRLARGRPSVELAPLIARVPAGGRVLLVAPLAWGRPAPGDSYGATVTTQGQAAVRAVLGDQRLVLLATRVGPPGARPAAPVVAWLMFKPAAGR